MNAPENYHILIIDDLKENTLQVEALLKPSGYQMTKKLSGNDAIEICSQSKFDLILLDIMMPGVTGFDVLKELKESPFNAETPVIFFTAYLGPDILSKAYQLGGRDYITKPFHFEELTHKVNMQLEISDLKQKIVTLQQEIAYSKKNPKMASM